MYYSGELGRVENTYVRVIGQWKIFTLRVFQFRPLPVVVLQAKNR